MYQNVTICNPLRILNKATHTNNLKTKTMKTENKVKKVKSELNTVLSNTDLFPYTEGERTKNDIIDLLIESKDVFSKILNKL